ncbi:condensation domain-containing protein [Kribbella sp. NPDC050820]|uniref:condensation domain-containing protein n=1 Tax=Kribbella sp. NPDC050820 TaxID=3155408 RepID=UPI0033D87E4D
MTMSDAPAQALLDACQEKGIALWAHDGQLRYRAPRGALDPGLLGELAKYKAELLQVLEAPSGPVVRTDPAAPFALTTMQSAYLVGRGDQLPFGGVGCHGYGELSAPDILPDRLEQAFRVVIGRHPMLRTLIDPHGTQQLLPDRPPFVLAVADLRTGTPAEAEHELSRVRDELSHRTYQPGEWPLFGLHLTRTPGDDVAHLSIDFLVADFVSLQIILAELEAEYLRPGTLSPDGPDALFADYVRQVAATRRSAAYTRDREYWLAAAEKLPPAPALPTHPASSAPKRFARLGLSLTASERNRLADRAGRHGLTLNAVLLTCYADAIREAASSPDFALNVTVLDRSHLDAEMTRVVGDFTRNMLLAVDDPGNAPFASWAAHLQNRLLEGLGHGNFEGVELLRELRQRDSGSNPMFPVVFTSSVGSGAAPARMTYLRLGGGISQTPQVWLDCQVMETADGLVINWDHRVDAVAAEALERMHDRFAQHIRSLARPGAVGDHEWISPPASMSVDRLRRSLVENYLRGLPGVADAVLLEDSETGSDRPVAALLAEATACAAGTDRVDEPTAIELSAEAIDSARSLRATADDEAMIRFADALDRAALLQMMRCLSERGLFVDPGTQHTLEEILSTARVSPAHHRLVRRWLGALVGNDLVNRTATGFRCLRAVSPAECDAGWAAVEAATPAVENRSELIEFFRATAAVLPELLDGSRNPLELLFPQARTEIHEVAYGAMFTSRYLNQLLSHIARRLCTGQSGAVPKVLEVGAGVGGTTVGVVRELAGIELEYTFTDVSQFFLNNARRTFADDPRLRFGLFDLNTDPVAAGYRPNTYDVIICANVLHYAESVDVALGRLRELLRPGGWLLMIEATRDSYQIMTSMEFLFDETSQHFTDGRAGNDQLFLSTDQWLTVLAATGADDVGCVPVADPVTERIGMQVFAARFKSDRARIDPAGVAAALAAEFPGQWAGLKVVVLDDVHDPARRLATAAGLRTVAAQATVLPTADEPPQGPIEERLAEVWKQLLRLESLGRGQRFYEAGGDSLLAAQIVAALNDEHPAEFGRIGFDGLLRPMLENASITELAELVAASVTTTRETGATDQIGVAVDDLDMSVRGYLVQADGRAAPELAAAARRSGVATMTLDRSGPAEPEALLDARVGAAVARILDDGHLAIVLAGAGSDVWLTQEIAREVSEQGGSVERLVLVLDHMHPAPGPSGGMLLPYAGDVDVLVTDGSSRADMEMIDDTVLGELRVHVRPDDAPADWTAALIGELLGYG